MNTVELSVRSKLLQIVEELDAISKASQKTSEGLENFSGTVGKQIEKQTRQTQTFLGRLRGMTSNIAKNMGDDFKALFSMAGLAEGLKLANVFRSNVKETFALSDAIFKLGSVFGITSDRFLSFQSKLTEGLGQIGLSSESAVNSLKGLSETQVRGEEQLTEYSKAAGQLASIGGQRGQEGTIAKGMAGVLTAQGLNPNDLKAMTSLSNDLRKVFNATGKIPTEVLSSLEQILAKMPSDLRKKMSTGGLVNLGVAAAVGGPNATKFLEEYLSKSPIARKSLEARGFKGVFGAQGLNVEQFRKSAGKVINQFPGDPRLMAQTLGLTEDAAEGFVRLYESLDTVGTAQAKMAKDTKDLTSQYMSAMTAGEAFSASLNKLKASFAAPIAGITNMITKGLQEGFQTSLNDILKYVPGTIGESLRGGKKDVEKYLPKALDENLGSTAIVAGGGILAAMMSAKGLGGLLKFGKAKLGGVTERAAFEGLTGAKVQDVYVVNAGEIGQSVSNNPFGNMGGLLGKIGGVGTALAGGVAIGSGINELIEGTSVERALDSLASSIGEIFASAKEKISGPSYTITPPEQRVRVTVDTKNKDLKTTTTPTRGAAQ